MCQAPWTRFPTTQQQWWDAKQNGKRHVLYAKYARGERDGAFIHGFHFSVGHPIYHTLKNAGWMGSKGHHSHMCKSDEVDVLITGCVHTVDKYDQGNDRFVQISSNKIN